MSFTGRVRELMRKYGSVALGVHFSVSAASIAGLYIAINNNVDIESVFHKVGLSGVGRGVEGGSDASAPTASHTVVLEGHEFPETTSVAAEEKKARNRTGELAASSGGALALAILCNKALIPVRVPITIALTPPIARFLRARNFIKNNV